MTTTNTSHACSPLVEKLQWRYATKKFDPSRKIEEDVWRQLEQALILTPSSFGMQPWKFVVVTDPAVKKELVSHSWNQNQPADCSHLVVLCRLTELTKEHIDHYAQRIAAVRNQPIEALQPFISMVEQFYRARTQTELQEWMARQCYIALGNLMTAAAMLGVDNCPMEGFVPQEYDRILKLREKGCTSEVVCALGYRAEDDKYAKVAKVRFPASEVVVHI